MVLKMSGKLMLEGFRMNSADNSLFIKKDTHGTIILVVYVDDIIITKNNQYEIDNTKLMLKKYFEIKDLGKLRYFLGLEVAYSNQVIFLYQRKYVLDLL